MQLPVSEPVIVILGPTAVGKTALSIDLAKQVDGEIISVDSRYFYRGMDIGTAKPQKEEMQGVPHHFIDIAEPDERISLGFFQNAVYCKIDEIFSRKKIPFLVGGTGQYLWGVIEGWQPPTAQPDDRFRKVLEEMASAKGTDYIYRMVAFLDPAAAKKIEPNNLRRSVRALEVIFSTGELFSQQKEKDPPPYHFKIIGLQRPRSELYRRVDERIDRMVKDGLVKETEALIKRGYDPELPSLSAIGYKEMNCYLKHEISLDEAIVLMKRRTRTFIRHQANWFKENDTRIHWFDTQDECVEQEILAFIQSAEGWL